ncbi:hypothetical protein NDU88_006101 [Pleurodeles waltl]|uniref:Uncharacterized protein n=1 Tax=Pleurodeles waltl TaxID=8319 RepID=A0AAV7NYE6_PLEWA|nr:hypothetical protein NDU88_006101 [Pleurodeles waltl]
MAVGPRRVIGSGARGAWCTEKLAPELYRAPGGVYIAGANRDLGAHRLRQRIKHLKEVSPTGLRDWSAMRTDPSDPKEPHEAEYLKVSPIAYTLDRIAIRQRPGGH